MENVSLPRQLSASPASERSGYFASISPLKPWAPYLRNRPLRLDSMGLARLKAEKPDRPQFLGNMLVSSNMVYLDVFR